MKDQELTLAPTLTCIPELPGPYTYFTTATPLHETSDDQPAQEREFRILDLFMDEPTDNQHQHCMNYNGEGCIDLLCPATVHPHMRGEYPSLTSLGRPSYRENLAE